MVADVGWGMSTISLSNKYHFTKTIFVFLSIITIILGRISIAIGYFRIHADWWKEGSKMLEPKARALRGANKGQP